MASFLRDQSVHNISVDSDALTQIDGIFAERFAQLQAELSKVQITPKQAFFTYIIRFDGKGYRVFSREELLRYYELAHSVERVIFTVESGDALATNRIQGAFLELCLDAGDPIRCLLISSSDNKDWAEASFAAVYEVLSKHRTKHGIAQSQWTNLGVQLLGVVAGFTFSLWLALEIAPNLRIENAFVISFLFILLLFSNIWGYLNQALLRFITNTFPNIEFVRPSKASLHWLLQTFVGTASFGAAVYLLVKAVGFLSKFISGFISVGA